MQPDTPAAVELPPCRLETISCGVRLFTRKADDEKTTRVRRVPPPLTPWSLRARPEHEVADISPSSSAATMITQCHCGLVCVFALPSLGPADRAITSTGLGRQAPDIISISSQSHGPSQVATDTPREGASVRLSLSQYRAPSRLPRFRVATT